MDKDEPRQLKLTSRSEGEKKDPEGRKKEKGPKGNVWIVFLVLLITVAVSLIFYFSGPVEPKAESPLGGPKVYQF